MGWARGRWFKLDDDLLGDRTQIEVRSHAPGVGPGVEDGQDVARFGAGQRYLFGEDVARLAEIPGDGDRNLRPAVDA